MTDSTPAGPSDRNVARLRQFKQARKFRIPGSGYPAAREHGVTGRLPAAPAGTWGVCSTCAMPERNRLESTEDFRVHVLAGHAPVSQPVAHTLQERRGTTQIEVACLRYAQLLQQSRINVPGSVKICSGLVVCSGLAVHDVSSPARELFQQGTRFFTKGMFGAIARPVDPPYLSLRFVGGECVQHRHDRRCAHAGAQQDHRILPGAQSKESSRCAHIQSIPFSHTVAEKCAFRSHSLALTPMRKWSAAGRSTANSCAKRPACPGIDPAAAEPRIARLEER